MSQVGVTTHALIRFIERVKGVELWQYRKRYKYDFLILKRLEDNGVICLSAVYQEIIPESIVELDDGVYDQGKWNMVVKDNEIITIISH